MSNWHQEFERKSHSSNASGAHRDILSQQRLTKSPSGGSSTALPHSPTSASASPSSSSPSANASLAAEEPAPRKITLADCLQQQVLAPAATISLFLGLPCVPVVDGLNLLCSHLKAHPYAVDCLVAWLSCAYDLDFDEQPVQLATLTVYRKLLPALAPVVDDAIDQFVKRCSTDPLLALKACASSHPSSPAASAPSTDQDQPQETFDSLSAVELADHLTSWARLLYDRISSVHLLRTIRVAPISASNSSSSLSVSSSSSSSSLTTSPSSSLLLPSSTFPARLRTIDKQVAEIEMWVVSTLLNAGTTRLQRFFDKFVAIAYRCAYIHGDFHSGSAIFAGLQHPILLEKLRLSPSASFKAKHSALQSIFGASPHDVEQYHAVFHQRDAQSSAVPVLSRLIDDLQAAVGDFRSLFDQGLLNLQKATEVWQILEQYHLHWYRSTAKVNLMTRFAVYDYLSNIGACLLLLDSDEKILSLTAQLELEMKASQQPAAASSPLSPRSTRLSRVKSSASLKKPVRRKIRRVFGVPLREACTFEDDAAQCQLPDVVLETLNILFEQGPKIQGIFRISPLHASLESCKSTFNKGKIPSHMEPHLASGLLKLYLRELPEPLFPLDFYDILLFIFQNVDAADLQLRYFSFLIRLLPLPNRKLFLGLLTVIQAVADNEKITMMGPQNLATVFAPTLCRSRNTDLMAMVSDSSLVNQTFEFIFSHPQEICSRVTELVASNAGCEGCVQFLKDTSFEVSANTMNMKYQVAKNAYAFVLHSRSANGHLQLEVLEGIEGLVPPAHVKWILKSHDPSPSFSPSALLAASSPSPKHSSSSSSLNDSADDPLVPLSPPSPSAKLLSRGNSMFLTTRSPQLSSPTHQGSAREAPVRPILMTTELIETPSSPREDDLRVHFNQSGPSHSRTTSFSSQILASLSQCCQAFSSARFQILANMLKDTALDEPLDPRTGDTALHVAARSGCAQACEMLVNICHASPTVSNAYGELPIHLLVAHFQFDPTASLSHVLRSFDLLVPVGVELCAQPTQLGNTVLHYAAKSNFPPFILALQPKLSDLLLLNNEQLTPFQIALAHSNSPAVAQLLLPTSWYSLSTLSEPFVQSCANKNPSPMMAQYLNDEITVLTNPSIDHIGVPVRGASTTYLCQHYDATMVSIVALLPAFLTAPQPEASAPTSQANVIDDYRIALFDYQSERHDILSFSKGDLITLLCVRSAEWAEGRTRTNPRGLFPLPYVRQLDAAEIAKLSAISSPPPTSNPLHQWVDLILQRGDQALELAVFQQWLSYGGYHLDLANHAASPLAKLASFSPITSQIAQLQSQPLAHTLYHQLFQAQSSVTESEVSSSAETPGFDICSQSDDFIRFTLALSQLVFAPVTPRHFLTWCISHSSSGSTASNKFEDIQRILNFEEDLTSFAIHFILMSTKDRFGRIKSFEAIRSAAEISFNHGNFLTALCLHRALSSQPLQIFADAWKDRSFSAKVVESQSRLVALRRAICQRLLVDPKNTAVLSIFPARLILEQLADRCIIQSDKLDYPKHLWNCRKISGICDLLDRLPDATSGCSTTHPVDLPQLQCFYRMLADFRLKYTIESLSDSALKMGTAERKCDARKKHQTLNLTVRVNLDPTLVRDLNLNFTSKTLILTPGASCADFETQLRGMMISSLPPSQSPDRVQEMNRYLENYRLYVEKISSAEMVPPTLLSNSADPLRLAFDSSSRITFAPLSALLASPLPAANFHEILLGEPLEKICSCVDGKWMLPSSIDALFGTLLDFCQDVNHPQPSAYVFQPDPAAQKQEFEKQLSLHSNRAASSSPETLCRLLATFLSHIPNGIFSPAAQFLISSIVQSCPAPDQPRLLLAVLSILSQPVLLILNPLFKIIHSLTVPPLSFPIPQLVDIFLNLLSTDSTKSPASSSFSAGLAVIFSHLTTRPIESDTVLGFALYNDQLFVSHGFHGPEVSLKNPFNAAMPEIFLPLSSINWILVNQHQLQSLIHSMPPPRRIRQRLPPPLPKSLLPVEKSSTPAMTEQPPRLIRSSSMIPGSANLMYPNIQKE